MHTGPSEASIVRYTLEKEVARNKILEHRLENLLSNLETECDIRADRTWNNQYHCVIHGAWFRHDNDEECICPVGEFAHELKKKYEQTT